jgi:predicted transcriptional regulator of viral defense system
MDMHRLVKYIYFTKRCCYDFIYCGIPYSSTMLLCCDVYILHSTAHPNMNQTRIQIAKPDIVAYFDKHQNKVFKLSELKAILSKERNFWRLAQRTTADRFVDFLTEHSKLKCLNFPFPHRHEIRYVWGDVPLLEVLLTVKPNSYFSHYTAVRMHGLTEQVPKIIYLNHEQHLKSQSTGEMEQGRIAAAFSRPHRMTNNFIQHETASIYLINGKNTNQLGVVSQSVQYDSDVPIPVRLTNIERTLIDITVRPAYAGGVFDVLKAFSLAKDQVSVNALAAMLQKIKHTYPYHQAIGYYLERAGYKNKMLDFFRRFPMEYDFYLANAMGETEYIKEWRLYVPKGF